MLAFIDTCALKHKYIVGNHTYRMRQVVSPRHAPVYIAEISMVEMISAMADHCIEKKLGLADFEALKNEFETDIDEGLIEIVPIKRDDLLRAQHLLQLAKFENQLHLKTQDALVAVTCRELALRVRKRVVFYTKDWKFYRSLYSLAPYRAALKLRFLGKGRGGIPSSTR